ncbi:tRNA(fMet)-specific endonuclease VapC [Methylotuvimicrobium sp. KM1]|uniref:type II toxin-antitoxin system tRNA(fMet)-specific endonuclease VapC n=1 Tax=Methylotuvimicrobium sp. KM1 TaxID=3377707 RepID=UPI00384DA514
MILWAKEISPKRNEERRSELLKYMLDTDTCIFTIKRRPVHVKRLFNAHIGQLCISSVTWGELVYGAENSEQVQRNLLDIEGFAARLEVLPFDAHAARQFGQLRAELSNAGRTIGAYDMMIAGHARSLGLIVVSNNVREFSRVSGIRLENWLENN